MTDAITNCHQAPGMSTIYEHPDTFALIRQALAEDLSTTGDLTVQTCLRVHNSTVW